MNACDTCEKRCHFLRLSWMSYLCHVYPVGHNLVTHIVTSVVLYKNCFIKIAHFGLTFGVISWWNVTAYSILKWKFLDSMMMRLLCQSLNNWTSSLSLTENLCLAETKQAWSIWNFYAMAKRWNKLFTDEIILWGPKSLIQTVNSISILTLKSLENRLNKLGNFWPWFIVSSTKSNFEIRPEIQVKYFERFVL